MGSPVVTPGAHAIGRYLEKNAATLADWARAAQRDWPGGVAAVAVTVFHPSSPFWAQAHAEIPSEQRLRFAPGFSTMRTRAATAALVRDVSARAGADVARAAPRDHLTVVVFSSDGTTVAQCDVGSLLADGARPLILAAG